MPIPKAVLDLVERFEQNKESYQSGKYNETQVRREFVDPFFKALGWDIDNEQGYAESYKDVIHEDAIRIGGEVKAPDYCFRVGGTRKFFVEAKKPSVNIKEDISPSFQIRRYAWSAKLPLSILTDFEEFVVYDTRVKPNKSDKASTARIFYCTYKEYESKWEEIQSIFSHESVLKGSFDKYADSKKTKKGTTEVDDVFLDEIEAWREHLAQNIALRNIALTNRELNFVVQRTIDRLIFLRISEDRGIEPYSQLLGLTNGQNLYGRLCVIFQKADDRYNSGLFHFRKEKEEQESPDQLSLTLNIDDKVLKDILKTLYYPDSPYEFSVLPADILGQVYEQFLGKVIRLTEGHRAIIEDKPEVKKAGGVYYTPTYIVDYIVKNTVGKLVENKTPKYVDKLKILDPACGSGSFLLGAYQYLLDWHLQWYQQDGVTKWCKGNKATIYQGMNNVWKLTTAERKKILLNNIYGVDIDLQAVEVTKLSLLLKVLEGETEQSLNNQMKLFHERALPDLGSNIKCGNSLISSDFYQGQMSLLDDEEKYRINVFDWDGKDGFPEIMKAGGFDAVVGNPPYILLQTLEQPHVFKYLSDKYKSARYKIDTYHVFTERALSLTKNEGKVGYIIPNSFLLNKHSKELRKVILESSSINILRIFQYSVFREASVDTAILIVTKRYSDKRKNNITIVISGNTSDKQVEQPQKEWEENPDQSFQITFSKDASRIIGKIKKHSIRLGEFATAYFGIQTFDRESHVKQTALNKNYKPVIDGVNIGRYFLLASREFVDFREENIKSGGKKDVYEKDRIVVRQIGKSPIGVLAGAGIYSLNTVYNIFFTKTTSYNILFILGIINSKIMGWYWEQRFFDQKKTFPKIKKDALLSIPIPTVDFSNQKEKAQHDQIVGLVDRILKLHKQLTTTKTDHEKTILQRQIDATDYQIDELVFELYGLSEEERKIVLEK